ncbi:MAG: hypothetical protein ACYDAQ_10725 [Mycobacteriales bacterium]
MTLFERLSLFGFWAPHWHCEDGDLLTVGDDGGNDVQDDASGVRAEVEHLGIAEIADAGSS